MAVRSAAVAAAGTVPSIMVSKSPLGLAFGQHFSGGYFSQGVAEHC